MKATAAGEFTVKMTPQSWSEDSSKQNSTEQGLGRFLLEKQYHGELEATAQGQMLSAGDGKPGSSAVYVAIERVTGTLGGLKGSFVLHHTGLMTRGMPSLSIQVAPDSGTDELTGLSGTLTIKIADGKHAYEFAYSLTTLQ
jgi:hypothetical protein